MTRADFDNYIRFREAAKKHSDELEKFIESKGYTARNMYEPEVIMGADGKLELITHFIISKEFPLD